VSQRSNGVDRFFHTDWLGSTRWMSDSTGNNFPSGMRYTGYGERSATAGSVAHPSDFQWAGGWGYQKEYADAGDPGIGLTYIQNRYYDSHAGRFMSLDPIRFAGGLNLYGYCFGDPINLADPDGMLPEWVQQARNWYMGGMGGTSDWVDRSLMGGVTGRLGGAYGGWETGCGSGWSVAGLGGEWLLRAGSYGLGAGGVVRVANYINTVGKGGQFALGMNPNRALEVWARTKNAKTYVNYAHDVSTQTHAGIAARIVEAPVVVTVQGGSGAE
jgi:RHS repeat-associated protein